MERHTEVCSYLFSPMLDFGGLKRYPKTLPERCSFESVKDFASSGTVFIGSGIRSLLCTDVWLLTRRGRETLSEGVALEEVLLHES